MKKYSRICGSRIVDSSFWISTLIILENILCNIYFNNFYKLLRFFLADKRMIFQVYKIIFKNNIQRTELRKNNQTKVKIFFEFALLCFVPTDFNTFSEFYFSLIIFLYFYLFYSVSIAPVVIKTLRFVSICYTSGYIFPYPFWTQL